AATIESSGRRATGISVLVPSDRLEQASDLIAGHDFEADEIDVKAGPADDDEEEDELEDEDDDFDDEEDDLEEDDDDEDDLFDDEQFAFVKAIDEYKRVNRRPFPSWTEVLEVIKYMGYRKVAPVGEHLDRLEPATEED